ncbi:MAG TPA: hypothetical protein VHG91_19060 [Longimicrobium sp.]|nr:hypothetical protein [Longimicrobium sp.]
MDTSIETLLFATGVFLSLVMLFASTNDLVQKLRAEDVLIHRLRESEAVLQRLREVERRHAAGGEPLERLSLDYREHLDTVLRRLGARERKRILEGLDQQALVGRVNYARRLVRKADAA